MKKKIFYTGIPWLSISFIILLIDYYSKNYIINNFILHKHYQLTKYLNLFYIQNFGIAFSFFSDIKIIWKYFFLTFITLIVCIIFIKNMYKQKINKKSSNFTYALIIGGALGNLYDRFIHGFVVDFIDFHILNLHLAIFNFADIAISIGILFMIIKHINVK